MWGEQGFLIIANAYERLFSGLVVTLELSFISMALSVVGGLFLGVVMASAGRVAYVLCKICLEIVRVMPPIVWLFVVYFGFSRLSGLHISGFSASVIVFGIWGIMEMMDLTRAAILSIPSYQIESAAALGLNKKQSYIYVILPLAARRLIPGAINLFSRIIKTTPIVVLIGVVELLKVGQMVIENSLFSYAYTPFFVYGTIFLIYFFICWPISLYSKRLEKKWLS